MTKVKELARTLIDSMNQMIGEMLVEGIKNDKRPEVNDIIHKVVEANPGHPTYALIFMSGMLYQQHLDHIDTALTECEQEKNFDEFYHIGMKQYGAKVTDI